MVKILKRLLLKLYNIAAFAFLENDDKYFEKLIKTEFLYLVYILLIVQNNACNLMI